MPDIFLLKGKESFIDHPKSVEQLGVCYWKKARNKRFQIGDICYLYLTGKEHNQIRYRLEVTNLSCTRNDRQCWKVPFQPDNNCYELTPTAQKYDGKLLSLDALEEIGINRHTQFCKLSAKQATFIDRHFKD